MRLYRCEAHSGDGRRPAPNPDSWVWQGLVASGGWDAMGRWFVSDVSILSWYARDAGSFRIVSIDVDPADAEKWRVSRNPQAQRFSRDEENEFFLPRDVAEAAVFDREMTDHVARMLSDDGVPVVRP